MIDSNGHILVTLFSGVNPLYGDIQWCDLYHLGPGPAPCGGNQEVCPIQQTIRCALVCACHGFVGAPFLALSAHVGMAARRQEPASPGQALALAKIQIFVVVSLTQYMKPLESCHLWTKELNWSI